MDSSGLIKAGFNELPRKALVKIFQGLPQKERQKNRTICKAWNQIILADLPVELTITNDNYAKLFRCPVAEKVTISNLTEEFIGKVAFAGTVRNLEVTGKVLSSNLIRILQGCQQLETLVFSSLKQVLEIESNEVICLPRATTLEFKVRPDQETFTSDEMIIISTLRKVQFGSLQTIVISVLSSLFWEEEDDAELDRSSEGFALNESSDEIILQLHGTDTGSTQQSTNSAEQHPIYPSRASTENPDILNINIAQPSANSTTPASLPNDQSGLVGPAIVLDSNSDFSTASEQPTEQPAVDSSTSDSMNSIRTIATGEVEFAGRLLRARMLMQMRNSDADLDTFLNDPSGSELRYNRIHNTNRVNLKTTVFFELLRNNCHSLKTFVVKTRPDFMCFGNLSPFSAEISKIQLEEVEYSFGRSQLCLEYMLLQVQSHLHQIRVHILDDLWNHLMIAVDKSQHTLTEADFKILSLSEDPIDLMPLSRCKELQALKLLHFFEKQSLKFLPNSLTKLVLNGPINLEDLISFTSRLINLVEFTLILNSMGGRIDVDLFKLFVTMPKISKLIFIQCLLDVNEISNYCQNTPGLELSVQGPRELNIPSIQYVMVSVNPSFDKQLAVNL